MSITYVASVIASYWIVSISMVYLNKIILSSPDSSLAAPLFVTWYQCVITCLICIVLGNFGERTRNAKQASILNDFPVVKFSLPVSLSVLPLSLIFVGMITFNNICLQHVAVSFCKRTFRNMILFYFMNRLL
jgi:GDP-fucose transporter C1